MDNIKLTSLLKSGSFIKIKTTNFHKWYVNSVISPDKESFNIALTEDFISSMIMSNEIITCKYFYNDLIINYKCKADNILYKNPPFIILNTMEEEAWKNARESERYEVIYMCKLILDDSEYNSYLTDINLTGARIVSSCQLQKLTKIKIYLNPIADNKDTLVCFANIVWNNHLDDNRIEYGTRLTNLTSEERTKIEIIIKNIKRKENESYNNIIKMYKLPHYLS